MPPPLAYTEQTLAEYLHRRLGDMADALGWSVAAGSYTEVVNDAMLEFGVTELTDFAQPGPNQLEQIRFLRVVAVRDLWNAVIDALAVKFDFQEDLQLFSRSQMQDMALKAAAVAETAYLQAGFGPQVELAKLDYHDPYTRRLPRPWLATHTNDLD